MSDLLTWRRMSSMIHILVIAALTKLAWRGFIGDFNVAASRHLDYNVEKTQANSYCTGLNLKKWVQNLPPCSCLLHIYCSAALFIWTCLHLASKSNHNKEMNLGRADTCRVHERPHLFIHQWTITSTCWFYLPRRHVSTRTLARIPS